MVTFEGFFTGVIFTLAALIVISLTVAGLFVRIVSATLKRDKGDNK